MRSSVFCRKRRLRRRLHLALCASVSRHCPPSWGSTPYRGDPLTPLRLAVPGARTRSGDVVRSEHSGTCSTVCMFAPGKSRYISYIWYMYPHLALKTSCEGVAIANIVGTKIKLKRGVRNRQEQLLFAYLPLSLGSHVLHNEPLRLFSAGMTPPGLSTSSLPFLLSSPCGYFADNFDWPTRLRDFSYLRSHVVKNSFDFLCLMRCCVPRETQVSGIFQGNALSRHSPSVEATSGLRLRIEWKVHSIHTPVPCGEAISDARCSDPRRSHAPQATPSRASSRAFPLRPCDSPRRTGIGALQPLLESTT